MNTALFLVGWLLTRVVLVNDKPLEAPTLLIVAALQVAASLVAFGLTPIAGGAVIFALLLLVSHERWFSRWLLEARFSSGVVMITLVLAADAAGAGGDEAPLLTIPHWRDSLWIAVGFLLVANEVNFVIRLLFRVFDLEPRQEVTT